VKSNLFALASIAAVAATCLAPSARAAPCVSAPVTTYMASGFSCNVDAFTFSNITIDAIPDPFFRQLITLGTIDPIINAGGDAGLRVNYTANVTSGGLPNAMTDITWRYMSWACRRSATRASQ
jgi:hypothetical protein